MTGRLMLILFFHCCLLCSLTVIHSWTSSVIRPIQESSSLLRATNNEDITRRQSILCVASAAAGMTALPKTSQAMSQDRSIGYRIQHSDEEWRYLLSPQQYYILRQGGTERPNTSVLESEERTGIYQCAGCFTPLFTSSAKFHSGTGWPSFASSVDTSNVQVESVGALQKTLGGAEVRCANCGGHLGDVFQDGRLFVGTPAFVTGERYCIDGGALIFSPQDGGALVRGDGKPKVTEPSWMNPPTIRSRDAV